MVVERESVESQARKKGEGGEVVMDTPERNKSNQIATPISKFEVFVTDLVLKFAALTDFVVSGSMGCGFSLVCAQLGSKIWEMGA